MEANLKWREEVMTKRYCEHCRSGTVPKKEERMGCLQPLLLVFFMLGVAVGWAAEASLEGVVSGVLVVGLGGFVILGLPIWVLVKAFGPGAATICSDCETEYSNRKY